MKLKKITLSLLSVAVIGGFLYVSVNKPVTQPTKTASTQTISKTVTNEPSKSNEQVTKVSTNVLSENKQTSVDKTTASTPSQSENKSEPINTTTTTTTPAPAVTSNLVKFGAKGDAVVEIQKLLNKFNYNLDVDGDYGSTTKKAVANFQTNNKLGVDGVVGASTLALLQKTPTADMMYKPTTNTTANDSSAPTYSNAAEKFINSKEANSSTKYYIWVSISSQKVYVFTGSNHNWKLFKTMACATGKDSTPTVTGTFSIQGRGDSFRADSDTICKYYTVFHGPYYFHSVLLNNDGTVQNGTLGKKASHGCVRLAIANAKWVHDTMPNGTTVFVN